MLSKITSFFMSAFNFPHLSWTMVLLAIAIGLAFGAVWLIAYRPPLLSRPWLWLVAAVSSILTWSAVAFIQATLQAYSGQALMHFWSMETLTQWLPLAVIPQILLSGLVQEGAKIAPVAFYWWRKGMKLDPKLGLVAGAVAGAGFGVFETVWVNNTIFALGWNWGVVAENGVIALLPFWERFFTVAFHIAASALLGYGLAKGFGWQFYVLCSCLHGALNYIALPVQMRLVTVIQSEIYVAVLAVATTVAVQWLLRRKPAEPGPVLPLAGAQALAVDGMAQGTPPPANSSSERE